MKIKNILKGKPKKYKGICVIAGNKGQVGAAIQKLLIKDFKTYGIDPQEKKPAKIPKEETIDFLHICIPFKNQDQFDDNTTELIRKVKPLNVIIHSSVLPGTTAGLFEKKNERIINFCYSPIRGQHDSLLNDIKRYEKYFSPIPKDSADTFQKHFQAMGLIASGYLKSPEELELVKLLDVCQYGILIGWAQECQRALRAIPTGYSLLEMFQEEHVKFYPAKRANITPGLASGHCVVQDAELVNLVFKSPMLKAFLESNERKRKEL